ncbi:MAG: hypothetical protein CBD47_09010 [Synechococcus sp. TMED187]|nr:MAG: hypothetical protein CBD47_09010 [Synechococcus sp. TMED187]
MRRGRVGGVVVGIGVGIGVGADCVVLLFGRRGSAGGGEHRANASGAAEAGRDGGHSRGRGAAGTAAGVVWDGCGATTPQAVAGGAASRVAGDSRIARPPRETGIGARDRLERCGPV